MQWTGLNELREKFLSFFESKGHLRLPSFPLIPRNDPSLLLINSGMAPMKRFFTGEEEPPRRRVTTCQKCIRTADLERVGHTARHGTFFEMLGNFSFGDYFKEESLAWAWEFLTEVLEIPADRLWPTIYEDDDEAFRIWNRKIGVPAERIVRLGKEDNFWEHGPGPCGPCSEICFDRGEERGCGRPDCRPGCDCDRFMEIWNNVFSQFSNDGNGRYTDLEHKNIDTGMGLERLACVMQDAENMFLVDTNRRILDTMCGIAGKTYGARGADDVSLRVCTDHIKSAMFMISDGVLPSNEGRGYVLRRIIRRACRHGKLLGVDRAFLPELCAVAIGQNRDAYPALAEKSAYILQILSAEEKRFDATLDAGLAILEKMSRACAESGVRALPGGDAFRLYDTFGFPIDLTREIAAEHGLTVDEAGFAELMTEQRERARRARSGIGGWTGATGKPAEDLPATVFRGYEETRVNATILALFADGEPVGEASGDNVGVVLDETPFYGESGGEIGDTGVLRGDGVLASVADTKKSGGVYVHRCAVSEGVLHVGDVVSAEVDVARRDAIMRNHSACHLLQAALRTVLGTHVEQAGSYVSDASVRFDFTHFAAMTDAELARVEAIVNDRILAGMEVRKREMPLEDARKLGAMALFGEKYGRIVRVVEMGGFSTELCGGLHVDNTSRIGLFRILSESSVASGVRRIEAVTGLGVLALMEAKDRLIGETARELKANNPSDIAVKAAQTQAELSEARREIDELNGRVAASHAEALLGRAVPVGAARLVTAFLDRTAPDIGRAVTNRMRELNPDIVVVLAVVHDGKLNFLAAAGSEAVRRGAHAGRLVGAVAAVAGGRGGGRPESATAGGRDADRIDEALASAEGALRGMLK